jgi:type IV pilus assembly protein PilW
MSRQRQPCQRGFTLLELLIGMALGLLVLGGVLTVYIGSSHSYRVTENSARLQEGARFALDKIGGVVRMSGHMGCFGNIANLSNIAQPTPTFTPTTVFTGQEAITSGAFTSAIAGTDALTSRNAAAASIPLFNTMANTSAAISIHTNTQGLKANDFLIISDCAGADLFCGASAKLTLATGTLEAAGNSPCTGNNPTNLSKTYSADAQIMKLEETTFYIRSNPANLPALYWQRRSGGSEVTEEIVEGVQDMQICYGEDTSGNANANAYLTAGNVTNWANVVSVRVALLLQSTENGIASTAQPYALDKNCDGDVADTGESVTPTDLRLRRVFTSTIGLRQRLP